MLKLQPIVAKTKERNSMSNFGHWNNTPDTRGLPSEDYAVYTKRVKCGGCSGRRDGCWRCSGRGYIPTTMRKSTEKKLREQGKIVD